jgi:hypothetical protein
MQNVGASLHQEPGVGTHLFEQLQLVSSVILQMSQHGS